VDVLNKLKDVFPTRNNNDVKTIRNKKTNINSITFCRYDKSLSSLSLHSPIWNIWNLKFKMNLRTVLSYWKQSRYRQILLHFPISLLYLQAHWEDWEMIYCIRVHQLVKAELWNILICVVRFERFLTAKTEQYFVTRHIFFSKHK